MRTFLGGLYAVLQYGDFSTALNNHQKYFSNYNYVIIPTQLNIFPNIQLLMDKSQVLDMWLLDQPHQNLAGTP